MVFVPPRALGRLKQLSLTKALFVLVECPGNKTRMYYAAIHRICP